MAIQKNAPNRLRETKEPFTISLNKTLALIPDPSAMGIYNYLAGKPADWIIQETDLMSRFNVGRDFIRSKMKILKDIGLILKEAVRDEKGRISRWKTTLLREVAKNSLCGLDRIQITENPGPGKSRRLENPTHTNKRYNEINNININGTSDEALNIVYVEFDRELEKPDYKTNQSNFLNENKTPLNENKPPLLNDVDNLNTCDTEGGLDENQQAIDLKIDKSLKSDYQDNHILNKSLKSDYNNNHINNQTLIKNKHCYNLQSILSENIFKIPKQIILDWIENRKKKRLAITQTSWAKITKELAKCKEKGIDPVEAFETMVASGWQSLEVEYFDKGKNTNSSSRPRVNNLDTSWGKQVFKSFHEMDLGI